MLTQQCHPWRYIPSPAAWTALRHTVTAESSTTSRLSGMYKWCWKWTVANNDRNSSIRRFRYFIFQTIFTVAITRDFDLVALKHDFSLIFTKNCGLVGISGTTPGKYVSTVSAKFPSCSQLCLTIWKVNLITSESPGNSRQMPFVKNTCSTQTWNYQHKQEQWCSIILFNEDLGELGELASMRSTFTKLKTVEQSGQFFGIPSTPFLHRSIILMATHNTSLT